MSPPGKLPSQKDHVGDNGVEEQQDGPHKVSRHHRPQIVLSRGPSTTSKTMLFQTQYMVQGRRSSLTRMAVDMPHRLVCGWVHRQSKLPDEDGSQNYVETGIKGYYTLCRIWLNSDPAVTVYMRELSFRRNELKAHDARVSAYGHDRAANPDQISLSLDKWGADDADSF